MRVMNLAGLKCNLRLTFLLLMSMFIISDAQIGWDYPPSLKDDVQFWKLIFTHYTQNHYLIHDADNPNIIYQVITFDSTVNEQNRERELKKIKDRIKDKLIALSNNFGKTSKDNYLPDLFGKEYGNSLNAQIYRSAAKQIRVQQGMKEKFKAGLGRALSYLPFIKEIFREQGLPEELAFLPHIESSFNPRAKSKVGAAGMWQFMRSTARLYMKVNRIIDQRYDPIISTRAAAKLLKYNYKKTGDWGLAITAYNFGLAGIKRAIKKYGSDYLKVRDSFSHRKFKFASRNFYPEFLAVLEIMQDYLWYFPAVQPEELPAKMRYQLKQRITLPQLAKRLEIPLREILELNPAYTRRAIKGWVYLPSSYWVNLPIRSEISKLNKYFHEKQVSLTKRRSVSQSNSSSLNRVVQPERSNSSAKTELASNSVVNALSWRKPGVISEGVSIFNSNGPFLINKFGIAGNILLVEDIKQELVQALEIRNDDIKVFPNETLGHFADWLKIPIRRLQQINKLYRNRTIYQGQKLKLDFKRVSKKEFFKKRYKYHLEVLSGFLKQKEFVNFIEYKITSGESVWEIANYRFKIPLELIQYFNIHSDINKLYPGDVLKIPILRTKTSLEETL